MTPAPNFRSTTSSAPQTPAPSFAPKTPAPGKPASPKQAPKEEPTVKPAAPVPEWVRRQEPEEGHVHQSVPKAPVPNDDREKDDIEALFEHSDAAAPQGAAGDQIPTAEAVNTEPWLTDFQDDEAPAADPPADFGFEGEMAPVAATGVGSDALPLNPSGGFSDPLAPFEDDLQDANDGFDFDGADVTLPVTDSQAPPDSLTDPTPPIGEHLWPSGPEDWQQTPSVRMFGDAGAATDAKIEEPDLDYDL